MRRFFSRSFPRMAIVAIVAVVCTSMVESQDATIRPAVDKISTQCVGLLPSTCEISVWNPTDLARVLELERRASRQYVDTSLAARLDKLNDDLVAKAVAANVKQSIVGELMKTLPKDPEFAAAVVSAIAEKAKQDKAFAEILKQLVQDQKSVPAQSTAKKSTSASTAKQ